jgi:tripartite-type tricarboxylate transporter receptor subunit TctC
VRDYSPISPIVREVNVLAVHPALPVKSVKELIALAKAKPGALNYSSNGVGTTTHLATELFKSMAGINMVHAAYQGSAPAIVALLTGEVQVIIMDAGLLKPHVAAGKLRALGATSTEPSALVPGLPTVAAVVPGFESIGYTALFSSGKPPRAIIDRLNQETLRSLARADVKERLLKAGVEIVASSPEQLATAMESDSRQLSKVIKDIGLRLE